ncbi:hypothetical protein MGG_07685 [Pyricularia oryzae 70-15]|uniref:Uncharacterized protein n=3 Tax=Pyricularia oryzae TaxID=318829 RepID=G4N3E4_PYRO7|nr:uncharacterized protein MGG_07685 [Pyricularia oryzae 70-15]EHA51822.1 hypothetical protein MGG_07685 [Pyricularia oryzae 70-15]ELQ33548.1 hypothetical protein OOU_Y34scaffold00926g8 [Pyricularia oryzae Y34]
MAKSVAQTSKQMKRRSPPRYQRWGIGVSSPMRGGLLGQLDSSRFVTREAKRHERLPKAAVVGASESGEQTAGEAEDPSAGQSKPLGPNMECAAGLGGLFRSGVVACCFHLSSVTGEKTAEP